MLLLNETKDETKKPTMPKMAQPTRVLKTKISNIKQQYKTKAVIFLKTINKTSTNLNKGCKHKCHI